MSAWRALPKNTGTAMRQIELLGKIEMYDKNLSVNRNEACTFCHMPYTGFTGPISSLNATTVAYPGSVHYRFGKRKPQGYTYSSYDPVLHYNGVQGDFYGGDFWDLRATGYRPEPRCRAVPRPAARHARNGVFGWRLSRLPDLQRSLRECVHGRMGHAGVCDPLATRHGEGVQCARRRVREECESACADDGRPGRADATFDEYALSIAAYEASPDISPFSSKFDAALASPLKQILTPDELAGWNLFRGKAKCNTCHLDGTQNTFHQHAAGTNDATAAGNAANVAPLFTDFTSSNLGVPRNPRNPFYYQNKPDAYGFTPNPPGFGFVDFGVGLFLSGKSGVPPNSEWARYANRFQRQDAGSHPAQCGHAS